MCMILSYAFMWLFLIYTFVGSSTAEDILINTKQGTIQGSKEKNYFYKFLGIPYAKPPVGHLRFKAPQPPLKWDGVKSAQKAGPICPQNRLSRTTGSEDCLYINVYIPKLPREGQPLKAVMLWIYGGSFQSGDGISVYGPDYLVSEDCVIVTFNYRLGVLGFLSLENSVVSGNYGLKDQVMAMKWVQENIENFGGDPNRVTLFGESAGGASVQYHLLSPLSAGLFQRAIIQSGSCLNPWALIQAPKTNAIRLAQTMGQNTTDENKLHEFYVSQDAGDLVKASTAFGKYKESQLDLTDCIAFAPCVESPNSESPFITKSPQEMMLTGNFNKDVPIMIGNTNSEGIVILAVTSLSFADFKTLNNNSGWAVPPNWNIQTELEKKEIGRRIKDYFMSGTKISWNSINDFLQIFTDSFFLLGLEQSISQLQKYSKMPIYNYQLGYPPTISIIKTESKLKQRQYIRFEGVAHADDICMIYKCMGGLKLPPKDQVVSQKMIKMWTSFAKTGNPNYSGLEVFWEKTEQGRRCYIEIGTECKNIEGPVIGERLKFWNQFCKDYNNSNFNCLL